MSEHEEMEMGRDLDQALRAAIMGLAQLLEKAARRAAQRDRGAADEAVRAAMTRMQYPKVSGTAHLQRKGDEPGWMNRPREVSTHTLVREWAQAAEATLRDPRDEAAAMASAIAAEELRRRGVDPVARLGDYLVDRTADRADRERGVPGAVLLPPGDLNPDRGTEPLAAATAAEAEHRGRAWELARTGYEAEAAQGGAFDALPREQQEQRYWDVYDSEAARVVRVLDLNEHRGVLPAGSVELGATPETAPWLHEMNNGDFAAARREGDEVLPVVLGTGPVSAEGMESSYVLTAQGYRPTADFVSAVNVADLGFRPSWVTPSGRLDEAEFVTATMRPGGQQAHRAHTPEDRPMVVIPAGRENPDRGMAPSKASSPEEAEHRRQAWSVARGAHAEAFDGDAAAAEKAWVAMPQQEQWDRFWEAYDTEAARTVGTVDAAAFLERIGASSPQEDTPVERVVELPTKQPGEQVQAVQGALAADMGAAAAAERGMKPSTAATPEEAEHRRRAWTLARADFATTLPEGTSKADVETKWRQLPWQDQALYYWRAYDGPAAAAPATPAASQVAEAGSTISRERVVELNGQAAKFFTDNAGPGSQGREYLEGRLGRGIVEDGAWQVGYAPAGWTNLTGHLRKNGATNEEILAAGLGVRSSRGNVIDTFRDRAMVGIRDQDGATVGFVGRDLSGDPRAPKYTNTTATPVFNKGHVLLGAHEAPAGADLVRVEGPFDAIAVTRAGEGRVAGVAPLGTALTDEQADALVQRAAGGRVLLGLDNDAAGRAATEADFWRLSQRGVDPRLLLLPPGQDPAQVWRENPEALRTLTGTTMVAPSAAVVVVERAVDELGAELRAGSPEAHEELAATYDRLSATLPEADQAQLRSYGQRLIDQLEAGADDARDRAARFGQVEDDARADMNAGNSDLDRHQVDGQSVEAQQSVDDDRGRAEQAHDRENAETTRAEQFDDAAGRARSDLPPSSASGPAAAADRSHDVGHGAGHEVGRRAQPAPQYDRAAETPGRDVPPEAKQARRVSAWGYDRSTSSMLGAAGDRAGRSAKRSAAPVPRVGRNLRRSN